MNTSLLPQKIAARIQVSDTGCWTWKGSTSTNGYGRFEFPKSPEGHRVRPRIHRLVWEALVGPIPEGMVIDHMCHNEDLTCEGGKCSHRKCCNPAHLRVTTQEENNAARDQHRMNREALAA